MVSGSGQKSERELQERQKLSLLPLSLFLTFLNPKP
jgi:hypothetical protein